MIQIADLSSRYEVRLLRDEDVSEILSLCRQNPQFYEYTESRPEEEEIRSSMRITPPGIDQSKKYFIGFFEGPVLVAVMDLIDGYPKQETAYIGFFMMNQACQGKGQGSAIISEVADYLKEAGKTAIRLAIDKGNPQSTYFWKKNGFEIVAEAEVNGWIKQVAERNI